MIYNGFPSREQVECLRKMYPVGTRVELVKMADIQSPPVGSIGTVTGVDSIGTVHINWGCGSSLGAVLGEDIIRKIEP